MQTDQGYGEKLIRVVVADNSRIHTQLLADALKRDRQLNVVAAAGTSTELLEALTSQEVDVAVIGCNLDEQPLRGIEVLRELKVLRSKVRTVVLLDSSKRDLVLDAFRAGARGLFSRNESIETLSKCVRRIAEGQIWANTEQVGFAVDALAVAPTVRAVGANGLNLLSKRELEVVRCLAEGLTNREIAARLGLSQHTIKNYLFRVFDKLGVSNRLELLFLTMTQPGGNQNVLPQIPDNLANLSGDDRKSLAWCLSAADQDNPSAQVALAQMYVKGNGVAKDPVQGYMWYLLSEKASGDLKDEILATRRKLAESMTTEQIVEAQKRASEKTKSTRSRASAAASAGSKPF